MGITKRDLLVGSGAAVLGACGLKAKQLLRLPPHFESKPPEPPPARASSYAQSGEDLVVSFIFEYVLPDLKKITYLDIGAAHPYVINNTYLFYSRGGRGVLVEPNPDLTTVLRKERPDDKVLEVGIGTSDEKDVDFYVMNNPDLSTFDKGRAEELARGGDKIVNVIKRRLVNVNNVMAEHFNGAPDFFSMDIEGLDLAVLKTIDFTKYRPKVICIETITVNGTYVPEIRNFLLSKDYVVRGETLPNTIFLDKKYNPSS
ncbi:MAG: FkbM family methyltransferase [Isosphaera sp.]|nr:FkbM family methyltransferase [Isosphaera sp.]